MVIDRTDELYKYLTKLGVDNIDEAYTEFASNGRYTRADVQAYIMAKLEPSVIKELDEKELEKISEEELKKYLSAFALLNYEDEKINSKLLSEQELENVRKLMVACQIAEMNEIDLVVHESDATVIDAQKIAKQLLGGNS